jgi:putative acetyltransferase
MQIRTGMEKDRAAIRAVNEAAFPTAAEANLVEVLHEQATRSISLVAEADGMVIGHIMFSPVVLVGQPDLRIMGLAPMAVVPERQHEGVGSALVRAGLAECARLGYGAVVVLGHPGYYPRFGFAPAAGFGIGCEYDVPQEAFMLVELEQGYLDGASGIIQYHAAFGRA